MDFISRLIGKAKGCISPNSGALIEEPPGLIYEVEWPKSAEFANGCSPTKELTEMCRWCREYVGVMSKHWDVTTDGTRRFIFLDEEDAMAFKLTWMD